MQADLSESGQEKGNSVELFFLCFISDRPFNTRSHADLLSKQVSNEKDHVIIILYVVCQLLQAAHGVRA